MKELCRYPKRCRRNIIKLMYLLSTDAETSYSMIRLTAALTDLDVDDDAVVNSILMDCGFPVFAEVRA